LRDCLTDPFESFQHAVDRVSMIFHHEVQCFRIHIILVFLDKQRGFGERRCL